MTLADHRVLRELQRFRGLPLKVLDLREMTGLDASEVTAALQRLEAEGHAETRTDHADRPVWFDPKGDLT